MNQSDREVAGLIQTIGHSTRSLEEFIHLLKTFSISKVVDIRTIPRSRTNPQFNRETLPGELEKRQVNYQHLAGLGGLRHSSADSPNTGWRNSSFRGFADYMQTPGFECNLEELIKISNSERVVLMCAEAVPWRCHRTLIADALIVRKLQVEHILSSTHRYPHKVTPWAQVKGLKITYPPENVKNPGG